MSIYQQIPGNCVPYLKLGERRRPAGDFEQEVTKATEDMQSRYSPLPLFPSVRNLHLTSNGLVASAATVRPILKATGTYLSLGIGSTSNLICNRTHLRIEDKYRSVEMHNVQRQAMAVSDQIATKSEKPSELPSQKTVPNPKTKGIAARCSNRIPNAAKAIARCVSFPRCSRMILL